MFHFLVPDYFGWNNVSIFLGYLLLKHHRVDQTIKTDGLKLSFNNTVVYQHANLQQQAS